MKYEIFEWSPRRGDYGSDWRRRRLATDRRMALYLAESDWARLAVPQRVFTAPVRGVGRLIASFPAERAPQRRADADPAPRRSRGALT